MDVVILVILWAAASFVSGYYIGVINERIKNDEKTIDLLIELKQTIVDKGRAEAERDYYRNGGEPDDQY